MTDMTLSPLSLFLRVYLPFAGAYFLSYLYRTVNAVVGPVIAEDLQLSASDLGFLSAAYFISFSAIQLPLGIALDRFGPRRVQTTLLLIAALGAVLFGLGGTLTELALGRALIGLGVAAGLMGSLKIITLWFPAPQWPLMNGLLMAAGGLGSLTATAPSQAALTIMSWHSLFFWLSGITVGVASLVWLAAPEKSAPPITDSWGTQIQVVGRIARDGYFWRILPVFAMQQASFISVQTLWVGPWLRDVAGQDATTRATSMLLIALAMTMGFLTSGMATGLLRRVGMSNTATANGAMIIFLACSLGLAATSMGVSVGVPALAIWCVFAFFGTYSILYFPVLTAAFPVNLSGRVTTSANFIMFGMIFFLQWGIGRVLDFWPRIASGGYAPDGYTISFLMLICCQTLGLGWLFLSRAQPLSERVAPTS
ncbi:MAG: MFS transporter [Alphaproteobacteria bacterium]|nr:MFS transporter [Alphaproteobacteria bacterium]